MDPVDYDRVAPRYDRRYRDGGPAGLEDVGVEIAARIEGAARGAAVLDDAILTRDGTCQLSLLSDAEFEHGRARICEDAMGEGSRSFRTDLRIFATVGRKA